MDEGADLAIICGFGDLPLIIKKFYKKAIYVTFNRSNLIPENQVIKCEFEKLGYLFDSLKQNGIRRVVMAGSIARPHLEESKMDEYTLNLMPKLLIYRDREQCEQSANFFTKLNFEILIEPLIRYEGHPFQLSDLHRDCEHILIPSLNAARFFFERSNFLVNRSY